MSSRFNIFLGLLITNNLTQKPSANPGSQSMNLGIWTGSKLSYPLPQSQLCFYLVLPSRS
jgi:hypothetical protein